MYNFIIHHLYVVLHSPSKLKSLSITIYPHSTLSYLPPTSPFPLVITIQLSVPMKVFVFSAWNPSPFSPNHSNPLHFEGYRSDRCASESILWISLSILFIRFHIWVKLYGICLSWTGLFHLEWYSSGLSRPSPVSYTHLTLPTNVSMCRSRWSPYH